MGGGISSQSGEILKETDDWNEVKTLTEKIVESITGNEFCERFCRPILDKSPPESEDLEGWKERRKELFELASKYGNIIDNNGGNVPKTIEELVAAQVESGEINLSSADRDDDEVAGLLYVFKIDGINEIPQSVIDMGDKIESLSVKKNSISCLPAGMEGLTNLKVLDVSENDLTELPALVCNLTNLESLNISENSIEILPDTIGNLTSLQTLIAFKNKLTKLPDSFGQCVKLEEVNFFNNKLIKVPDSISDIESLVDLNLGGNKLKTLPSTKKWTNLERLALSWNTVVMLNDFGGMPNLRQLQLNRNQLGELPADCLQGCTNLEVCDLSTNRFESLPSMTDCENLQTLDLTGNQISSLGDLTKCVNLKILKVGSNKIAEIGNIGECINLETLFLCSNPVTTLVPEMETKLVNLKRVNIKDTSVDVNDQANQQIIEAVKARCTANKGRWIQ